MHNDDQGLVDPEVLFVKPVHHGRCRVAVMVTVRSNRNKLDAKAGQLERGDSAKIHLNTKPLGLAIGAKSVGFGGHEHVEQGGVKFLSASDCFARLPVTRELHHFMAQPFMVDCEN